MLLFSTLRQNECIVEISAEFTIMLCFLRCLSSGFCSSAERIAFAILSRISLAAASVKVRTSSSPMSAGFSFFVPSARIGLISSIMRCTKTAVLPEPAAAARRMFSPPYSIASLCSFVQFIPFSPLYMFFGFNRFAVKVAKLRGRRFETENYFIGSQILKVFFSVFLSAIPHIAAERVSRRRK